MMKLLIGLLLVGLAIEGVLSLGMSLEFSDCD